MCQRDQLFKVHVSPGPMGESDGCLSIFGGGRYAQGGIQKLCAKWHLYFDLKTSNYLVSETACDVATMT